MFNIEVFNRLDTSVFSNGHVSIDITDGLTPDVISKLNEAAFAKGRKAREGEMNHLDDYLRTWK